MEKKLHTLYREMRSIGRQDEAGLILRLIQTGMVVLRMDDASYNVETALQDLNLPILYNSDCTVATAYITGYAL